MIELQDIKRLVIEPTSHCNLHCPQCDRFDQQGFRNKHMSLGHLDFSNIKKNLDIDSLTNLGQVRLEGEHGDPAMHPGIVDMIQHFSKIKSVELVTNGSLHSKSWWQELAQHPNLTVTFSIDGLEDTNNIYRINSNWNRIIDNAKSFINSGGRAIWKYIVFKHNEHQVDTARSLATTLGFTEFKTHISNRNFYRSSQFPIMVNGVYQGTNLEMASTVNVREHTKDIVKQTMIKSNFVSPSCSWLDRGSMYLDYQGNVIPCCMTSGLMWRNDISGQLWRRIVGDVNSINLNCQSLAKILQSDFYQTRLKNSFRDISTVHHTCYGNCSKIPY